MKYDHNRVITAIDNTIAIWRIEQVDKLMAMGKTHDEALIELGLHPEHKDDEPSGWFNWEGGRSFDSYPDGTMNLTLVQVRLRGGSTYGGSAGSFKWDHIGHKTDIIAYRILK